MCYFLDSTTTRLLGNMLKKWILALFMAFWGFFWSLMLATMSFT